MKKYLTLFFLASFVLGYSQSEYRAIEQPPLDGRPVFMMPTHKQYKPSAERAATVDFMMDYSGFDAIYSNNIGFDYTANIGQEINAKYNNNENLSTRYIAVKFDTLMYEDQAGNINFYPKSQATLTLDSFDVLFIHTNTTGGPDTIKYTVFNTSQASVTGYGSPGAVFTTPKLWDTVIITNTSLSSNPQQFDFATFYPNISLPQGQSFGIRVDFSGDTANKFYIPVGYRDECAAACVAEVSYCGNNTAYYLNLTTQTGQNLSGYFENDGQGAIYYDCDQSGGFTVGGCENFFIQNARIISYVTANLNYGATIVADSLRGCPSAQLNLSANAFGSAATPFTYAWATTSGNLTSTSDQNVSLVIGNSNAVVTVTVTDANNQTTTASVTVQSRGINVSITNSNPLTINCGSNATLLTSISGFTTGKFYTWSNSTSGPNAATTQVSQPGNYKVTVTNNAGCSASASIDVQYPGGLTNTVSFTFQTPVCQNIPETFTNNSARKAGWNSLWTFGDNNTSFNENGSNTYSTPGVYPVKLTMDSAGCSFSSATQNVTVLASSNASCINIGIGDVTFSNNIALLPNPTNGNVTINVSGVEKNLSIRVYSIIGSEVMNFNTTDVASIFNRTFDFSSFANGTYLVKIQSGEKTAVKRLTVAK